MDRILHGILVERLVDASPGEDAESLVLAACEGEGALEAELRGETAPRLARDATALAEPATGVYLASVTVSGFRGVGPPATLTLNPYPSLTLVVGRNGSGKSSFAEAVELLLTGTSRRWAERSQIWRAGWRNLHQSSARIAADFIVEGRPGRTSVARSWADDADLDQGSTQVDGKPDDARLSTLGWAAPLEMYRPLLPHNELGAVWDEGPTRLHDALSAMLGLGDIAEVGRVLRTARLARESASKAVATDLAALRTRLEAIDDERARICLAATKGRVWNLPGIAAVLAAGSVSAPPGDDALSVLRQLSVLTCPDAVRVREQVDRLRAAAGALLTVAGTDAGRARSTARLLEAALRHVETHDGDRCPVCGTEGVIDDQWRDATRAEVDRLSARAAEADAAHQAALRERQLTATLMGQMPGAVHRAADVGIDASALVAAWARWSSVDHDIDLNALADHVERGLPPLLAATDALRAAAAAEMRRREDVWRPLALDLGAWLPRAQSAVDAAASVRTLKSAEDWVKGEEARLRDQRFAPIAGSVQENWTALRQESSVTLGALRLEGSGPRRRVALDVSIDGAPSQALGVMSQGELNALALSLFLPRATLPQSPFRFVLIDDPVQAMDPNKVEGLARVLQAASATHQVVVFTHDERLPAAVRHLDIEATIVEVVRRENSVVELRQTVDPVQRHIDDAFAVANSDELPEIARRVVGTFCRLALEAAASDAFTRRRLRAGQHMAEIEGELTRVQKLTGYLALALFDDAGRHNDVIAGLQNRWGQWAGDVFFNCRRSAHDEFTGDLRELCRGSERLAGLLRSQP